MDGNGEGMVAVVHGLHDVDLAVALVSTRCAGQARKMANVLGIKNQSLPQMKSSVEANPYNSFDGTKSNAGVQICDDRYASSYQLAHCRIKPTSPPVSLSEFPPQRTRPNRSQGNFEVGGFGSGEVISRPIRKQYSFISSIRWANRRSVQFNGASCQTDPFAHSLRRYPTFLPIRSISADLIDRLIRKTQAKNLTKPSKLSKSVRSIPKGKPDGQTNRQGNKRSKNIQTYTRRKKEDRSNENNVSNGRRERSLRLSLSGDRRSKKNKDGTINTTYDYLKGNSALYRRRQNRFTDVRYLDHLSKYIKDTLEQICNENSACPNIRSRYSQHRKKFHHDQLTCKKNCPKRRKICECCHEPLPCQCFKTPQAEAGTSSPSLPIKSEFCQCLPEDIEPEKIKRNSDNNDAVSKDSVDYYQQVFDVVSAWVMELPVKAGDTAENVAVREKMGKQLADVLKNIPRDKNFDDNVMDEGKMCLDKLHIWLPDKKAAQDAFKDLMVKNLSEKLKKIPEYPNNFTNEGVGELPVDNRALNDWVDKLIAKVASSPKVTVEPENMVKPLNDILNIINSWLDHEEFSDYSLEKNSVAVEDLAKKVQEIKRNGVDEDDMKNDIQYFLKTVVGVKDPVVRNKLTNKLLDKLIGDVIAKTESREEELKKVISKVDNDDKKGIIKPENNKEDFKQIITKPENRKEMVNKLIRNPENSKEEVQKIITKPENREMMVNKLIRNPENSKEEVQKILTKPENREVMVNKLIRNPENSKEEVQKEITKSENRKKEVKNNITKPKNPEEVKEVIAKPENRKEAVKNYITKPENVKKVVTKPENHNEVKKVIIEHENRDDEVGKIYQAIYNWMKNRPQVSHLNPGKIRELTRELANVIYDNKRKGGEQINISAWLKRRLSGIGGSAIPQSHQRKKKNSDLIINYEVKDDMLDDDTDRLRNKTYEGVKRIYAPDQPGVRIPKDTIKSTTKKTLHDEIDNLLDKTTTEIQNEDVLKSNLINTLVDGVLKAKDQKEIKKDVYDKLRAENLPKDEAKDIAQKLLDKSNEMALAMKSKDSRITNATKLSKAEPSTLKNLADYQQKDAFIPNDVLKLNMDKRGSSFAEVGAAKRQKILEDNKVLKEKFTKKYSSDILDGLGKDKNIDLKGNARDGTVSSIESYMKDDQPRSRTHSEVAKVDRLDPKTTLEIKQPLNGDIQNSLGKAKTKLDERGASESKLVKTKPDQVEFRDVKNVRDDVYKLQRNSNIPREQAKDIPNKMLGKSTDLSKVAAHKTKAEPLTSRPIDSKNKQEIKQSLKSDLQDILDKAKTKVNERDTLESNLLNTILDQVEEGDVEDVREDVYRLLYNANIPLEQAKDITSKILKKSQDLSKVIAQKTKPDPLTSQAFDSKTRQESKQPLNDDIQDILGKAKTQIDERDGLESNLPTTTTIPDQVEAGDVRDVRGDVYRLLRNDNIPLEQAKDMKNKILGKSKDLSKVIAQKTKPDPSTSQAFDSKTKQESKQSLNDDIQDILGKAKTKIDERSCLKPILFNTIPDQEEAGDVKDVRGDVYRLLRNDNIPLEQAKDMKNKILGKSKDLSKVVAQKSKTEPLTSRSLDSKNKQKINQSLNGDLQDILGKDKTKINERGALESNFLNTIPDQVETEDVKDVRGDVYRLPRKNNIPLEQAKDITSKILGKSKDLYKVMDQRIKSRSRSDYEDTPEEILLARMRRPYDSTIDSYSKRDHQRDSITDDVNNVINGTPLPLSSRTKDARKSKLSDALIQGIIPLYSKGVKSIVLHNILSEESIEGQTNEKLKAFARDGQKVARRRDSTGRTKNRNECILREIGNALDDAPTRMPKSNNRNLKKKLADIVLTNITSDVNDVRLKIMDLLTRETHFHKGIISDLSSDIIARIIDVLNELEIAAKRKAKKIIYNLQMERKKPSKLFPGSTHDDSLPENYKRTGKRRKNDSFTSDDDSPISRAKSPVRHDSISGHIDDIIAKEHIQLPQYKIDEIKHTLQNVLPEDISAMMQGDKGIKNKILGILSNEIELEENDTSKPSNEDNDSQNSINSSQMEDMTGNLKDEALDLMEKYNVQFSPEGSLNSDPPVGGEVPFSSTPRDDIGSPEILNEPTLSTVYDDDEVTLKTSDRINSAEYFNRVVDIVDNWVEALPIDSSDENFRKTIVKDLVADIIERQRYLQLNSDAKPSAKEELECLKYQVFRWMNNLSDVGDLTTMMPMITELRDRIDELDLPMFNQSSKRYRDDRNSNGKERKSDAFIDKFVDWVESLPMKFKNEKGKQYYENIKSELFRRLKELGPQASPRDIQNEINMFLRKANMDPSKNIDSGYKKLPNILYDFIEQWCDSLPFDNSLDQDTIKNMKYSLANKILQKICQLNLNPETLNDDFLYEDILRDEIDNLLSEIRNDISIDDEQLVDFKDLLVNKIKEAKQETQNEIAGQMYKQQLRDAVSRTLPPGLDLSSADHTSLDILKDAVTDAFINLNYSSDNDVLRNKMKRKIADAVTKFCNNYLQRHPAALLRSNELNQDLYDVLKSVSLPNDESMRSAVEHVRMKYVITDWVGSLPLAVQTPTEQSTLNKMISILAKRLHDLENAGELNDLDYTEEMKTEITKWLQKLRLLGGNDSIVHYAADLMDRLKNTEDSRRFDSTTRLQDRTEICPGPCNDEKKVRPKPPRPCPDTCVFPPQVPSSLTREDREHLDRIRERVQQGKSKLAKRPCRDASPSPCIDTGSQIDIRARGSIKSIPSVCAGPFQRPYKSAASRLRESPSYRIPCRTPRLEKPVCQGIYAPSPQPRRTTRRTDGASPCVDSFSPCNGSYIQSPCNEVQPQIIVKEYYWDSTGNSTHQIPCRPPYDTCRSSQEPRSRSRPTPPCRGQYSPPHSIPQSPQMSSSDQETRRAGTSIYHKERVTRLGSLDVMTAPNMNNRQSDNFDWNSAGSPEDDDWESCQRPMILSDDDCRPFSRERERNEQRVRCRCRERVLSKCATKRRSRFCAHCNNSRDNETPKRASKCNAVHCPHPSYLYFRN